MSLRLRTDNSERTLVAGLRSRNGETSSLWVWLAFHRQKKDWLKTFLRALDLLMEEPMEREGISFAGGAGSIVWQRRAFWTIIRVELSVYSLKKRRLIAAGLLKAARNGV